MTTQNVDRIINPQSVAIIGASDKEGTIGFTLTHNLLKGGFQGRAYPVALRAKEILGQPTYASIRDVPEAVDLALVATPAKTVPDVIRECGEARAKGAVVLSGGFKETGAAGKALEDRLMEVARAYDIRVVGPNCLGVVRPGLGFNGTFLDAMPEPGNIAFISQSGALGSAVIDVAIHENIGFSAFVSVGSMVDVDFGDLIDYFGSDPYTRSILMYIEGITNARNFMSAARHFARTKPIIVVKAGRYRESARAVASHTGSLSGEDQIYDAAFKRAGVVRVDEISDLFNAASVLSAQPPLPKGPRLAIVTNAGGPGIMATDSLIGRGGTLAELSPRTLETLNAGLPPFWSHGNPIDVLGDGHADRYRVALTACLQDDLIDGVLILHTQQAVSKPVDVAKMIVEVVEGKQYPSKTILTSFLGRTGIEAADSLLAASHIPLYPTPEQATKTFVTMNQYRRNLALLYETPRELPLYPAPPKRPIAALLRSVAKSGRTVLTEEEAKRLLRYYDFPTVPTVIAYSADDAVASAGQLGYPVVLKILSPDISHKTEAGGVALNLGSEAEVRKEFDGVIARARAYKPDAEITGVTVQPMVRSKSTELIIGGKTDPIFGPVVLFGMGGVAVELLKDTALGLPPLSTTLIHRMLEETKVYQLLKGHRNQAAANLDLLDQTLLRVSQLMVDFPQIKEIDMNPTLIGPDDVHVLDARVVVDRDLALSEIEPRAQLVISPYPQKYEARWTLRSGEEILLRPIRPEDEPMWIEMFRGFSEESIRYRFFTVIKDTPHEMRVRYCNIDYDREIAIVAELSHEGHKQILGVGRLPLEAGGKKGELAFIISDKWQGMGLGTKVVDHVLEVASDMGVEEVYAFMLPDNYRAQALLRKMGFELHELDDGTVRATLTFREAASDETPAAPQDPSASPPSQPPSETGPSPLGEPTHPAGTGAVEGSAK
jgi:acetyltransferase